MTVSDDYAISPRNLYSTYLALHQVDDVEDEFFVINQIASSLVLASQSIYKPRRALRHFWPTLVQKYGRDSVAENVILDHLDDYIPPQHRIWYAGDSEPEGLQKST